MTCAVGPPNILLIMSDEHSPRFSGVYGHPLVRTPQLERLAGAGALFESAYCNTPLCVPSRMSFMTGRYPHRIGVYDNACSLSSDAVTWAHLLRSAGYDVALAGKQHFVGPDQLHGFRAQLARDLHAEHRHPIYPWDDGIVDAKRPWPGPATAGPGSTESIETDEAVQAAALAYLRDPARAERPWALNVSFIAPHFPLVVPQQYWDLYPPESVDLPVIPPGHLDGLHPVYQRMRRMFGLADYPEEQVRRARAGYYALVSYLDDKIGGLLDALEQTGHAEDTLVVYTSDHGEMNGEHGMWRKSNFYEDSVRVPLIMRWPGRIPAGGRIAAGVSLVDVAATLIDAAGAEPVAPLDGASLLPLAGGADAGGDDEVFAEYLAHGVAGPMAMLRRGRHKLNYSLGDKPELYDLADDPGEFTDLAGDPAHRPLVEELTAALLARWDPVALDRVVRQSQRERALIAAATPTANADIGRALWPGADADDGQPGR